MLLGEARALALETVVDGCLAEGLAALVAQAAAERATGRTKALLSTIAEEEARHAALAFEIFAFYLQKDFEGVKAAFANGATLRAPQLKGFGLLSEREVGGLRAQIEQLVVEVVALALGGSHPPSSELLQA